VINNGPRHAVASFAAAGDDLAVFLAEFSDPWQRANAQQDG
jgi:hypothetical protein